LAPFYKSKSDPTGIKTATKAIQGNIDGNARGAGGSATMTAADFVTYWRDRYNKYACRASIDVADSGEIQTDSGGTLLSSDYKSPGDLIRKAYENSSASNAGSRNAD